MKNSLLKLIGQLDEIKTYFHKPSDGSSILRFEMIYDSHVFSAWKQELLLELQDIYDHTNDKFIWNTLVILKQRFNGWTDKTSYNELAGCLQAIKKNIDKYYLNEIQVIETSEEVPVMEQNNPKVFISHSSLDKNYVSDLVEILVYIGLSEQQIFCSSVPGFGIPLDQDIYDYLKQQFQNHSLHVFYVLSENYYGSVACMNEMGAAWILKKRYTTILLPGFEFKEVRGAINPGKIGLKLDNDLTDVKEKLGQLKDILIDEFGLSPITDIRWEQKRDAFIKNFTQNSE